MKTKKSNTVSIWILEAIFFIVMIVLPLSNVDIMAFFHFDIITHNVYISSSEEYTIMRVCGAEK